MRIGEILISARFINAKQLEEALSYAAYKGIPIGRALRVLRFLHEDDLSRCIEAQKAIRKGVDSRIALELIKVAKENNRTFFYQLEHNPLALKNIPTVLIENILDKKFPKSLHQQLRDMGAPVAPSATGNNVPAKPAADTGQRPAASQTSFGNASAQSQLYSKPGEQTLRFAAPPTADQKQLSAQPGEQTLRFSAPPPADSFKNSGVTKEQAMSAISAPRAPVLPLSSDTSSSTKIGPTFDALLDEGDKHFANNDIQAAERSYQKARAQAEEAAAVRPSRVAIVLTKLANLYMSVDRFAEAQPLYERVLEINIKLFGPGSPQVTRANEDLAELFDLQSKIPQAKRYMDDAIKNFYQQERLDLEVGARLLKRLLTITKKTAISDQQSRMRIGELAADAGMMTRDQLQTALQQSKQSGAPIGAVFRNMQLLDSQQVESLMYAQVLIKQGTIPSAVAVHAIKLANARKVPLRQLFEAGKLITDRELNRDEYQGLVLEQEKMLSAEAALGPDHLDVAKLAQSIAKQHVERKDWLAAEAMCKRAISILEKKPDHKLDVARSCEILAEVYCQNGKFVEAQPLLFRSLELRQVAGQGETVDAAQTLWQLGRIELAQFNEATAISFLRTSRSIYEKLQPGSSPRELLEQLSNCCLETGLTAELEPILLQLIDRAHKENRAFDEPTATYCERLADIYLASGRAQDAQMQFQFALQIHQQLYSAHNKIESLTKKLAQATAAATASQ